jgi:hypothetical protein
MNAPEFGLVAFSWIDLKMRRNSAPNFKRLVVLFASDFALRGWTRQCGAVPN